VRKAWIGRRRQGPQYRRPCLQRLCEREVPATWVVLSSADSGDWTLREALTELQTSTDPDNTIILQCGGTITLQSALPPITKNLTIEGANLTVRRDPNAAMNFTIFNVAAGTQVSINDLTISGGNGIGGQAGGGIYNEGNLSLNNDELRGNVGAADGGAIFNAPNAQLTITSTLIDNNESSGIAGAIDNLGDLQLTDSQVFSNESVLDGGGLYLNSISTTNIFNSLIYENKAGRDGGGIWDGGGVLTWQGGQLTRNDSTNSHGAGLFLSGGTQATLSGVSIEENTAALTGGGFYLADAGTALNMGTCTISNNGSIVDVNASAGGLSEPGATYTTTNCTVTDPIVQQ
jgi:hypothetical protein